VGDAPCRRVVLAKRRDRCWDGRGRRIDLLARNFPGSRVRLDGVGVLFGEASLGPLSQTVVCAGEGAVFTASMVSALALARRRLPGVRPAL
jgi:hypothetical protein